MPASDLSGSRVGYVKKSHPATYHNRTEKTKMLGIKWVQNREW